MLPRFSPDYRMSDLGLALRPHAMSQVTELERRIARRAGQAEAICLRYGRAGLYFLLRALGARGKRVVMPAYTCVVVAHAVKMSGNEPVFVDNAPGSLQPSQEALLAAMDDRTAVVLPTHLFGIPVETAHLIRKAQALFPSALVIQDCAHSFFCESEGGPVSALGDGALFGMNISKLVNTVYGGAIALKDERLAREVRRCAGLESERVALRAKLVSRAYAIAASLAFTPLGYGLVSWLTRSTTLLDGEVSYYHPDRIDLPRDFRQPLTGFEAAIGLRSLERWESRVRRRREITEIYFSELTGQGGIDLPPRHAGATWSHFPVRVAPGRREAVKSYLEEKIGCEIGTIVDYSVPGLPAYGSIRFPMAESAAHSMINLPLTFAEGLWRQEGRKGAKRVSDALREALHEVPVEGRELSPAA